MSKVGIIANPASGKDIRRLIAYASVTDNTEKTNLIRRIIVGIDSTGVEEIMIMPDYYNIGQRALAGMMTEHVRAKISIMDIPMDYTAKDSRLAAEVMGEQGVKCIVTLGGDGTNRDVAKGKQDVPLVPLSTGTNNVFPVMTEPTSAGIAAGIISQNILGGKETISRHKRLVVIKNGEETDMALVDVVVLDQLFTGSRAIWKLSEVREIICTRAEPNNIGMTCIGGNLHPVGPQDRQGLYIRTGSGEIKVKAAILPGMVSQVEVAEIRALEPGEEVNVVCKPSVIALDGEREITVAATDEVKVRLQEDGPRVVDIEGTIRAAVSRGYFRN